MNYYQPNPYTQYPSYPPYYLGYPAHTPEQMKEYEAQQKKRTFKKTCTAIGGLMLIVVGVELFIQTALMFIFMMFDGAFNMLDFNNGFQGFEPTAYFVLVGLSSLLFNFFPGFIYVKVSGRKLSDMLTFERIGFKKLVTAISVGLFVCMFANFVTDGFSRSLDFFFNIKNSMPASGSDVNTFETVLYIIAFSLVPAFAEEFLFRGVVLGTLRKYGDGFAIFASALLFGLLHGNFVQIPFAFIVGLVLGYIVCYTNSLLPSIIVHFLNNFLSVATIVFFTDMSDANAEIISLSIILAIFVIGLFAFSSLAKNDKEGFLALGNNNTEMEATLSKKVGIFFTSATVIIFMVAMILMAAYTLTTYA